MATNSRIATVAQPVPPHWKAFADFRTSGLLAKRPGIGIMMFILGILGFGALTYNLLAHGPLLAWDQMLANTLPAIGLQSPLYIKMIMDAGFYAGSEVVVGLGLMLGLYFIHKKYWQELAMLTIGMAGSSVLFLSLSNLIARPRPPTQIWIILKIPGFPSGHAIAVVTFYGLVAYLLTPKIRSAFWKASVVCAALFVMLFVGFSRIFTGGHYLTDILSGYAVGIAWSGAVYTLIEIYYEKRRIRNVKQG